MPFHTTETLYQVQTLSLRFSLPFHPIMQHLTSPLAVV